MTNFTFFAIAFLSCLLGIILGRMSVINDINQKLKPFKTQKFPIINMGNLYRALRTIISDLDFEQTANRKLADASEIIHNENEDLQAKYDKMSEEYKDVLKQLKDKMNECIQLRDDIRLLRKDNNLLEDNLTEAKKRFDNLRAKVYKLVDEINTECGETISIGAKYAKAMDKSTTRSIYAHMLHNKTTLLTAGICAIEKNGKVSYPAGSRSLGNAQSKENAECFAELTASLNLKAGESKIIGVISNYAALKACAKTYSGINHGVTKIMGISADLLNYLTINKNMLNKIK